MSAARSRPQFLFPDAARFGHDNLVLHARARRHTVSDFTGPLSIKTVLSGVVTWRVAGRDLPVDPATFLVLNQGETYSMDLDAPRPLETACAFFRQGFVETLAQDAATPLSASLDHPGRPAPPLLFLSRLHADPNAVILHRVQTLARRCSAQLQPSSIEEDFLLLADSLLLLYSEIRSQIARLPAVKPATREELFRRLQTAREYLHGSLDQPISLDATARTACLSPYHFHRAFTQAIGQTPHAYLTRLRLSRAQSLLRSGAPVIRACSEVGFTSTASFTRLFRAAFGVPPSAFRNRNFARSDKPHPFPLP